MSVRSDTILIEQMRLEGGIFYGKKEMDKGRN